MRNQKEDGTSTELNRQNVWAMFGPIIYHPETCTHFFVCVCAFVCVLGACICVLGPGQLCFPLNVMFESNTNNQEQLPNHEKLSALPAH